ncbi:recombinase family protein [Paenibacillus sp. TC-CSREp1]|uniref:recombinase family protein n=1 Tax=Paenibacillus sp. TC-CSREp1 TaxID=3410089 RepID=UPI003D02418C
MKRKLIRYNMQIAMLKQLLSISLITEHEFRALKSKIMKDYGVISKGLKMKMKRGELVGFQSCLGYEYDVQTKKISVNEQEAEIVRYIFERYIAGYGAHMIAKELTAAGHKTRAGRSIW